MQNGSHPQRYHRLKAEHARVQEELAALEARRAALETRLTRHDVHSRFKRAFPAATAGYPLYGR